MVPPQLRQVVIHLTRQLIAHQTSVHKCNQVQVCYASPG
jgi:hypothetical protein